MRVFKRLFDYKAWADAELLAAVRALPAQPFASQIHTMTRTLNHIHVVDQIFKAHLCGQRHGFSATNTEATPTLDELSFGFGELDAWFQRYVAQIDESGLNESVRFQFTDGDAGTMSRAEMLHHVLAHGAYHRGNVGQVMKSIDIAPPRDLLTKYLHHVEPTRRTHAPLAPTFVRA
jgi:uncharacterized damage-inducible protein DinB